MPEGRPAEEEAHENNGGGRSSCAAVAKPQQKTLKTKEEEAVEAARRRELDSSKARERWKADWIKAVMGATVILVPTIILVFFFVTFSLVEPEKKVGSDDAQRVTE